MNKTTKLIKNTGIYLIANMASKFLNVILVPIYTAYLQTDDFGNINLLLAISGVIGILISLDVTDASYRYLLDNENEKDRIITNSLFIYFFGALLFSAIYFPVTIKLGLKYGYILGFHILLTSFQQMQQQIARGMRFNKIYASAGVIMCLVQGISNIVMIVCFGIGSISILIAPLIASLITIFYVSISTRMFKEVKICKIDFKQIKSLIIYGTPVALCILFTWVIQNSGSYIITWITGTTTMAGVYALANKFPAIISAFTSVFALAWQETSVEENGSKEYVAYCNKIYNRYFSFNIYAIVLVMPVISIYFMLFNTGDYALAKTIIPILLVAGMAENLRIYLLTSYYVEKKTKEISQNALIACCITMGIGYPLMIYWNVIGLAVSIAIGQIFHYLLTWYRVKKYVDYRLKIFSTMLLILMFVITTVLFFINSIVIQIIVFFIMLIFTLLLEKNMVFMLCHKAKNSNFL